MCRALPVGGCSEVRKLTVCTLFAFLPAAVELASLNGSTECVIVSKIFVTLV
jgi:hypothetical protein